MFLPPRYARRAVELIPDSRLKMFTLSGHAPHKNQPSAFNRELLSFLGEGGDQVTGDI